jgi:acetyltransferase-like isoleucine patch superfamily enzyme
MKFNNRNILISKNAQIGENVRIGDNSVIYDNVEIGDNSTISNNCVIGEPANNYYSNADYQNPKTIIGRSALVRSHTIIYCDVQIGKNFKTGHRVTIREKTLFGVNCHVGTLSDIQGHTTFGNYCQLHSNVHIGQKSKIGNFVFIYPYVIFTNDPHPPSNLCIGPSVDDYTQIAVSTILLPGVKVGKNCLLGANSTIKKDVPNYSCVAGNPAQLICDTREIPSREKKDTMHYPWMNNFDRGMPWQNIGFSKWKKRS